MPPAFYASRQQQIDQLAASTDPVEAAMHRLIVTEVDTQISGFLKAEAMAGTDPNVIIMALTRFGAGIVAAACAQYGNVRGDQHQAETVAGQFLGMLKVAIPACRSMDALAEQPAQGSA